MLGRHIRPKVLLERNFSTVKPKRSILSKVYRLSKLIFRGTILGGVGYFIYHTIKKGKEVQYPEVRRPLTYTSEESHELKQLNEIEQFAQIPLGKRETLAAQKCIDHSIPDTVVIQENKHPLLKLPAQFNLFEFELEMKELTNTMNSLRDVLRHISKDFQTEAASRMSEHEKQEQQLKHILSQIQQLRQHKFSQALQNQQKWLSKLKIGSDEVILVMAELMQLSIKQIKNLEQYMAKFDGLYKDVLKTVQLIALSDACTIFFSDLSQKVKAFLNETINQEDDYYRDLLNSKYKYELEILADKGQQVRKRTKRNSERAGIEEAAHNFNYSYLKHEHDKRDFIVKLKLLISLLQSAVIQQVSITRREQSFSNVLVYFRALSKKDKLLESAYEGFIKDDPKVVRGVPSIYNLQRDWKRLVPQAQIAQFYSVLQPKFFQMGLIVLWFQYLRPYSERYNASRFYEMPLYFFETQRRFRAQNNRVQVVKCWKVDIAIDRLDQVGHFLNFNQLQEAMQTIEGKGIQDKEMLKNFKNKLQRRIKLEELRTFLVSYTQFLEKTV